MTELNPSPRWVVVARWVAVLPGAVLAAIMVRGIAYMGGAWFGINSSALLWPVQAIVLDAAFGYVIVKAGAQIAPARRVSTAVSLAIMVVLLALVGVVGTWMLGEWQHLLNILGLVAGAGLAGYQTAKGVE